MTEKMIPSKKPYEGPQYKITKEKLDQLTQLTGVMSASQVAQELAKYKHVDLRKITASTNTFEMMALYQRAIVL